MLACARAAPAWLGMHTDCCSPCVTPMHAPPVSLRAGTSTWCSQSALMLCLDLMQPWWWQHPQAVARQVHALADDACAWATPCKLPPPTLKLPCKQRAHPSVQLHACLLPRPKQVSWSWLWCASGQSALTQLLGSCTHPWGAAKRSTLRPSGWCA